MTRVTGDTPGQSLTAPSAVPSAGWGQPGLGCLLFSPRRGALQGILTLKCTLACGQGGRRPQAAFRGTRGQRLPSVAAAAQGGSGQAARTCVEHTSGRVAG